METAESKNIVEEYAGRKIYLTNGWFCVDVGDIVVRNRTLEGLKRKIAKNGESIRVFLIRDWSEDVTTAEVIRDGERYRALFDGKLVDKYVTILEYNEEAEKEFKTINAERAALSTRYRAVKYSLKRLA